MVRVEIVGKGLPGGARLPLAHEREGRRAHHRLGFRARADHRAALERDPVFQARNPLRG